MANLLEILNTAAIKGGVQPDSPELKTLLSSTILSTIEVPAPIEKALNENLLSIEAAKSNTEINKYFKHLHLDLYDEKLYNEAKAAGIDEEDLKALKEQKNSFEKPSIIREAIKKLQAKAKEAKKDGNTDSEKLFKEQIAGLQQALAEKDQSIQSIQAKAAQDLENFKLKHAYSILMSSFNWSDAYDPDDRPLLFENQLNKELSGLKAKVIIRNEQPVLVDTENPNADVYDTTHKKITLSDVANRIASKYQKVTDTSSTKTTITVPSNGKHTIADNTAPKSPEAQKTISQWREKLGRKSA